MAKYILLLARLIRRFPLEKFEYALDLYIRQTESQLATSAELPTAERQPETSAPKTHYDEHELMLIKDAERDIPASRTKIYQWRKEGKLHTVERSSRNKRLIRTEVEMMRKWASDKGKR